MPKSLPIAIAFATIVATLPGAAQATSTTCSTSVVCAEYINTYSSGSGGVAIHGEANGGIGIRGTSVANTGFYGASGSGSFMMPSVEGESTKNKTADAGGAFGLAYLTGGTNAYGVAAYGAKYGVYGSTSTAGSPASFGVVGFDNAGNAPNNAGVAGVSTNGNVGILGESDGTPSQLLPYQPVGVYGVAQPAYDSTGTLEVAIGVEAESTSIPFEAVNTLNGSSLTVLSGGLLISGGLSQVPHSYFQITNSGNATFSGTVTTSKSTYVRTAGTSGTVRVAYGTRSTAPEIEDVGEGHLVDGRAVVPIDPAFADTIDMRRAYHVFITPEGDCKGLYVTQKTPESFVVRELQSGHATLAFEYRIVAKPHDENGNRLALAPERPEPALRPGARARIPATLTPEAQLKAEIGPAAYARVLAALKARVSER